MKLNIMRQKILNFKLNDFNMIDKKTELKR